ncbi:MAG: tRNA (adenosine(37)-N6)-threonylcarbamoyltransferase complex transferase subunit TsaD [Holosporales bacterium]|jgi:N6-L-threonylcarbamoyladenine synthase|nr:tRNA (adenosine(37)-N6)-threonylcarbamoyltransferase complex transferase subunit TsaD [Holosporales bacterium]
MGTKILAIESSCDETSAAVVTDEDPRILSNIVYSQIEVHKKYGGVVPEQAARCHIDNIDKVITEALDTAKLDLHRDIDIIAVTAGPGLIGGLLVGVITAKTMALLTKKPFMAINHLEAHILTPRLCYKDLQFPYVALLASGGHFIFAEIKGTGDYRVLGETLDDAAGEAFDKVARMLGFPYPGGPSIEMAATKGDKNRFQYTIPLLKQINKCNGSFSGLKTATKIHIEKIGSENLREQDKCDIAASFQETVTKFIVRQFLRAISMASSPIKTIVLCGGVAANKNIRNSIQNLADIRNLLFYAPPLDLCSDNAAMIGWSAIERNFAGFPYSPLDFPAKPRWRIDTLNQK